MNVSWVQPIEIVDLLIADAYRDEYISNDRTIRNSGFEIESLGELCDDIYRGNTPPHQENSYWNAQVPKIVKTVNIRQNLCDMFSVFDIEPETYSALPRFQLSTSDIAITIMGATPDILGRAWAYQSWIGKACFSDAVAAIKNVSPRVDREFLASYLNSHFGHQSIMRWSGSSTREYITNTALKRIPIPIPDPKIQAYIGDKVRLAEKCREEANRLYKSAEKILSDEIGLENIPTTFAEDSAKVLYEHNGAFAVQIEPGMATDRLDAQGYHPEILHILANLNKAKCKFVPLNRLGDVAPTSQGTINGQSSDYFVSILHVDDKGVIDWQEAKQHKPITKGLKVLLGDILISRLNPKEKRIGVFNCKDAAHAGCSSEFSVFKAYEYPYYLAFALSSNPTHRQLVYLGRGTSSSRRRIDERDLKNVLVPVVNGRETIDCYMRQSVWLWQKARELVDHAIMDTEDLIQGSLNTSAILSGQIHSPTWEEIQAEANQHA